MLLPAERRMIKLKLEPTLTEHDEWWNCCMPAEPQFSKESGAAQWQLAPLIIFGQKKFLQVCQKCLKKVERLKAVWAC